MIQLLHLDAVEMMVIFLYFHAAAVLSVPRRSYLRTHGGEKKKKKITKYHSCMSDSNFRYD